MSGGSEIDHDHRTFTRFPVGGAERRRCKRWRASKPAPWTWLLTPWQMPNTPPRGPRDAEINAFIQKGAALGASLPQDRGGPFPPGMPNTPQLREVYVDRVAVSLAAVAAAIPEAGGGYGVSPLLYSCSRYVSRVPKIERARKSARVA